jgi:hypothetical protein
MALESDLLARLQAQLRLVGRYEVSREVGSLVIYKHKLISAD